MITGAGSGIGLFSAHDFAQAGMLIVIVDRDEGKLADAADLIRQAGAPDVMTSTGDVSDPAQLQSLEADIAETFGSTDVLMNNTGVSGKSSAHEASGSWASMLGINP
ncbi:MAG: SDR family oxidoreductase [Pseudomonadota bacterium]